MTPQNVPPENVPSETSPPGPDHSSTAPADPSTAYASPSQADPLHPTRVEAPGPGSEQADAADDPTDATQRIRLDVSYPRAEAAVLAVSGEIDAGTVEQLEETLRTRLTSTVRIVVVDLTGLDFLAVTGLHLLRETLVRARSSEIDLRIAADGHEALHGLRVAGLDAVCHPNTADALADGSALT